MSNPSARRSLFVLLIASFALSLCAQSVPPSSSFPLASFSAPRVYGPSGALAVGDFNGDGRTDVAMGSYSPNSENETTTVSIWLGEANGSLRLAETYTVGPNPTPIIVGDFNGDGKLDLALSTYDATTGSSTISLLLGNGDGTFRPPVTTVLARYVQPYSVSAADFNGDGKLDLAVVWGAEVLILLGNGDGTFTAGTSLEWSYYVTSVTTGDFNGDGKPDLAVVAQVFDGTYCDMNIYLGNGDGTFQPPVSHGLGYHAQTAVVADFNRDGKLDLAVTIGGNYPGSPDVGILLGNGDGTFQAPVLFPAGDSPFGLTTADVNGDGNPDLIVGNIGAVDVLLGKGDGTFQAPATYLPGGSVVLVGDFNGDGTLDILTGTFWILWGKGNGTFRGDLIFNPGITATSIVVGDFNGDGKSDLAVAANTQNEVSVLLGEGNGLFGAPKYSAVDEGAGGIVAADFNRDGKLDLAVTIFHGNVGMISILLGNGDGTFATPVNYAQGIFPNGIAIGDFNGDGKIDLAVVSRTALSILLGNGDGTFQPAVTGGPGGYAITVGDFNRDGKQDLAITNYLSPGAVLILLGNGNGTFQSALSFPVETYPVAIVTADFNGDGKLDLAVGNSVDTAVPGAVSILLGKGDGTFQPAVSYDSGGVATESLATGDFNGDGKPDLAVANYYTDDVSILLGTGTGSFFLDLSYAVESAPSGLAVGYFNQDRKPDIAIAGGAVTVLLNSTP